MPLKVCVYPLSPVVAAADAHKENQSGKASHREGMYRRRQEVDPTAKRAEEQEAVGIPREVHRVDQQNEMAGEMASNK